ncbi:MAG: hypothetical protein IT422_15630 [Pirellulaceae bacterium]|nr:hypothetical protein [Pirellulaceae bacterium]
MDGNSAVTADNWKGVFPKSNDNPLDLDAIPGLRLAEPWDAMTIHQQSALEAYQAVLADAGGSLPKRDEIDTRIIEGVRTGTASRGDNGFILNPSMAGGWSKLESSPAPEDSDHDGMPDSWEAANRFDPNDGNDGNAVGDEGYTMLEKYLNSLVSK